MSHLHYLTITKNPKEEIIMQIIFNKADYKNNVSIIRPCYHLKIIKQL